MKALGLKKKLWRNLLGKIILIHFMQTSTSTRSGKSFWRNIKFNNPHQLIFVLSHSPILGQQISKIISTFNHNKSIWYFQNLLKTKISFCIKTWNIHKSCLNNSDGILWYENSLQKYVCGCVSVCTCHRTNSTLKKIWT